MIRSFLVVLLLAGTSAVAVAGPARPRWIDLDLQFGPSYFVEDSVTGSGLRGAFSIAIAGRTSFEISVAKLAWDNYPDVEDMMELHVGVSHQLRQDRTWFEPHVGVGTTMVEGNDFGTFVKSFTVGARVGYDLSAKIALAADARYTRPGWFDDIAMPHADLLFGVRFAP